MTSTQSAASECLPDIAAGSVFARFGSGARFAIDSLGYTWRHPRLLRAAILPMVLQLALFIGLGVLAWHFVALYSDRVAPAGGGTWAGLWRTLVLAAFSLVGLVATMLATMVSGNVICDPFYDAISEGTEALLIGRPVGADRSWAEMLAGIARELGASLFRLAIYLAGVAALFAIGMVPGAAVVTAPVSMGWTWLFLAVEVLSRSQGRHAIGGRARLGVAREHLAIALGFGAVGWLIGIVPFTTPLLVVGGTRLYLALAAHGRIESGLGDEDKARLRGEVSARAG